MQIQALQTPVAFFVFNRPHTTRRVFEAISRARPVKLLLIADGPRPDREGEIDACRQVRDIVARIDWPCAVSRNFSENNLGCGERMISGLNWVFSLVEEAIILEDDCLPDLSFFPFCQELLERYRGDHRIAYISGDDIVKRHTKAADSYYFSQIGGIWGWATWRSEWRRYDRNLSDWPELKKRRMLEEIFDEPKAVKFYTGIFDAMYEKKGPDTWDYQWNYTNLKNNSLAIVPNVNLIANIGFGEGATHTTVEDPRLMLPTYPMEFPLRHPPSFAPLRSLDRRRLEDQFPPSIPGRILNRMRRRAPRVKGDDAVISARTTDKDDSKPLPVLVERSQASAKMATNHVLNEVLMVHAPYAHAKCHICGTSSEFFDEAEILHKHLVRYFRCTSCGFVQTEAPYWLKEAYSSAISELDTGILSRNLSNQRVTTAVLNLLYSEIDSALDYGAGHGIFVRLMRDSGFNFFWYDLHATNDYARGFEHQKNKSYNFLTCFEVLEHLVDPLEELSNIMRLSPNVFFTTMLLPQPTPKISEWWYYSRGGGQHVSLYTLESLRLIARRFGRSLLSRGAYHLFTTQPRSKLLFGLATRGRASTILSAFRKRTSLVVSDFELMSKEDSQARIDP